MVKAHPRLRHSQHRSQPGRAAGVARPSGDARCVCAQACCAAHEVCVCSRVCSVCLCTPCLPPGQSWEPRDGHGPLLGWGARCAEGLLREAADLQEAEESWTQGSGRAAQPGPGLQSLCSPPCPGRRCTPQSLAPGQTGPSPGQVCREPGPCTQCP